MMATRSIASLLACLVLATMPDAPRAADGDLDPSFDVDGRAWYDWPASFVQVETLAVVTLPDASVVAAGWADNGNNNRDFAVVKFDAEGGVDTGFGTLGHVVAPFDVVAGGDDRGLGIFPVSNGRLLVVGYAQVGGQPYAMPALMRLTSSGQPDTSFGPGGRRVLNTQPLGSGASFGFTVAKRGPDGRIVLAGYCQNCGNGGPPDFVAVRFTAEGEVDTSFGNAGWVSFGRSQDEMWLNEQVVDVAIDGQGRVVLGGFSELPSDPNEIHRPLLVRYTATGQLDLGFSGDGYEELALLGSWRVSALAMDPVTEGPLVALGLVDPGPAVPAAFLLRYSSSGVMNTAFGDNGIADLTREEGAGINALAVRADRRIMAAGWIDPTGAGQRDVYLARVLANGDLDSDFDGNGVKRVPFDIVSNAIDEARAITFSNDRAVVAGSIYAFHTDVHYATLVLRLQSAQLFADGFE